MKRCWKASLRLCAGSVEMTSTDWRTPARRTERMELQVVLPTPPLPPTKTHLRESWSRRFRTVGSGASPASTTAADAMLRYPRGDRGGREGDEIWWSGEEAIGGGATAGGQKRYWNCRGGKYLSSSGRFLFTVYCRLFNY